MTGPMPYILYPFQALLLIAIGVAGGVLFTRRFSLKWKLYGVGAAAFALSQAGDWLFLWAWAFIINKELLPAFPTLWLGLMLVFATWGLIVGVCGEGARYIAYRWFAKEARSWRTGLLLGAGHGGGGAAIVGILMLVDFVWIIVRHEPRDPYLSEEWYTAFLVALVFALMQPIHLWLSLVVLRVFTGNQIRWLWQAIAWHAATYALIMATLSLAPVVGFVLLFIISFLCLASISGMRLHVDAPGISHETRLENDETAAFETE
ncbi:MAG: YhfC family intramembrane metalloprotease [Anaerolineae bacterium]|nr:YhfC family intramembrane metalloprotease [Anaerolineae bacterium]